MILLLGPPRDPMVADLREALGDRATLIYSDDMPATVRFCFTEPGGGGYFASGDHRLPLDEVRAVYHRVGFSNFEVFEDYTEPEVQYVNAQCQAALYAWLNLAPALVVNRPVASGSNASKPYQIELVRAHGFSVPKTLVTTLPQSAAEFWQAHGGDVIYKSVSYVRSIVTVMKEEDLERLETVRSCPVQLQEMVPGHDIRVHVVGQRVFAHHITAEESDYRYDKGSVIVAHELPDEVASRCVELAAALDLPLAGIDLRVTPEGEYYCFEVNPSPAFSWYEARTGQRIAAALADLLTSD